MEMTGVSMSSNQAVHGDGSVSAFAHCDAPGGVTSLAVTRASPAVVRQSLG